MEYGYTTMRALRLGLSIAIVFETGITDFEDEWS